MKNPNDYKLILKAKRHKSWLENQNTPVAKFLRVITCFIKETKPFRGKE